MRVSAILGLLAIFSMGSFAGTITFTFTATGSGTIGTTSFTDAVFTLTAVGDTADRFPISLSDPGTGFIIGNASADIAINGVGTFQLVTPTDTFVNHQPLSFPPTIGLSVASPRVDLIHVYGVNGGPGIAGWDMLTSFGPITGSGRLLQWDLQSIVTTGGTLFFNNQNDQGSIYSFEALSQSVSIPEPGCCLLVAAGIAGVSALKKSLRRGH